MSKRKLIAVLMSLSLLTAIPVQAQSVQPQAVTQQLKLKLNGQYVQVKAPLQSFKQRTLISLDDLAKLVNGKIGKDNQVYTLTVNTTVFAFDPYSNEIRLGGHGAPWTKVDQGPIQVSRTTLFVPLRVVLEKLGFKVKYDPNTRTIFVSSVEEKGEVDVFKEFKLEELKADEKKFVEEKRRIKGVHQQGDLVVIALGEMPNPGYGIKFVRQLGSWEQVRLFVELTKPEPGKMYPQVISYPYLVGKIKLAPYTTLTVVNESDNMALFDNKDTK